MKTFTLLTTLLLAGTYALAADKAPASEHSARSSQSAQTKGKVTAVVISSDATANTVTVRPASGSSSSESFTLPVEGKAVASLKSVKNGERVDMTCRSSASSSSNEPNGSTAGSSGIGATSGAESAGSLNSGDRIENPGGDSSAVSVSNCSVVTEISKAKAATHE